MNQSNSRSIIKYSLNLYFREQIDDIIELLNKSFFLIETSYESDVEHYYLSIKNIDNLEMRQKETLIVILESLMYRSYKTRTFISYTSQYDTGNIFVPEIVTEISYKLKAPIWVSIIS